MAKKIPGHVCSPGPPGKDYKCPVCGEYWVWHPDRRR